MSEAADKLVAARMARNAARAVVDGKVARIKNDLATRSIGGRVADKIKGDALSAVTEGIAVARDSKLIVAGTLGTLALWFLRAPLLKALAGLFAGKSDDTTPAAADEAPIQNKEVDCE